MLKIKIENISDLCKLLIKNMLYHRMFFIIKIFLISSII